MKIDKILRLTLIVIFATILGACNEDDNEAPAADNQPLTINGIEFNSELNTGGIVQVVDFHGKGSLYPSGAHDGTSYPQVALEFICKPFDLTQSSIGKTLEFNRISCGYFEAATDFRFYYTLTEGTVRVANINMDQRNNGTITLHFDNVKLPEKDNPTNCIIINGNLTFYK